MSFVVYHNRLKLCTAPKETSSKTTKSRNEQEKLEDSVDSCHMNMESEEQLIALIPTDSEEDTPQPRKSQRNCRPPNRFGNNVYDYDDLIP